MTAPVDDVAAIAAKLRTEGRESWITVAWNAFCDADPLPSGVDYQVYLDWLDETPLVHWRSTESEDLDDAFAEERGIVPGGMVYCLTPLGLTVREHLIKGRSNER